MNNKFIVVYFNGSSTQKVDQRTYNGLSQSIVYHWYLSTWAWGRTIIIIDEHGNDYIKCPNMYHTKLSYTNDDIVNAIKSKCI